MLRLPRHYRDVLDIFERSDARLRVLDLDLIGDTRIRIGPIVRGRETAGVGRFRQGAGHLPRCDPQLPGQFSVHLHVHTGIVERQFVFQVAQIPYLTHFATQSISVGPTGGQVWSKYDDFDWRRGTEIHDLVYEITWLERESRTRKLGRQRLTKFFFQRGHVDMRLGPERHVHDRFVRTA